jgi:hypothetical protein
MRSLDYFELISPEPVVVEGIGAFRCPTLRTISKRGYALYQRYLGLLSLAL